jgi:magnesium chelatase subunit I
MRCPECGTENDEDSILCINCLADLEAAARAPAAAQATDSAAAIFEQAVMKQSETAEPPAAPSAPMQMSPQPPPAGSRAPAAQPAATLPPLEEVPPLSGGGEIEPMGGALAHGPPEGELETGWIDRALGLEQYVGEESLCPQCESIVSVYADKCSHCGAVFVGEECRCGVCGTIVPAEAIMCDNCKHFMVEEETRCPVCSAITTVSTDSCQACGVEFAPDEYRCATCTSMVDAMEVVCPSCGNLLKEGVRTKEEAMAAAGVGGVTALSGSSSMSATDVSMNPDEMSITPESAKIGIEKVQVKAEIAMPEKGSGPVAAPGGGMGPGGPTKRARRDLFPFSAIVGQEMMKLGLILNAIDSGIGGVLLEGQKGAAKSVTVRGLAELLPTIEVVQGCRFSCDPNVLEKLCFECKERFPDTPASEIPREERMVFVVDLPLNATEDRVVGTINVEKILTQGLKAFEHGILAEANRALLYVDEINLLDDYIVDVLLDAAAMGVVTVEREGVSVSYPAKFIIIGSMNPEEGALRPQLLDRIGLVVKIRGIENVEERIEIVKRRDDFDKDPAVFRRKYAASQEELRKRIADARKRLPKVECAEETVKLITRICLEFGTDGHRADLCIERAARAHAAFQGRDTVTTDDIAVVAEFALPHRMRKRPFEEEEFSRERLYRVIDDLKARG